MITAVGFAKAITAAFSVPVTSHPIAFLVIAMHLYVLRNGQVCELRLAEKKCDLSRRMEGHVLKKFGEAAGGNRHL
jgi:hypothetical protein